MVQTCVIIEWSTIQVMDWITNEKAIIQVIGCMNDGLNNIILVWYSRHDLNTELEVQYSLNV